MKQLAKPWISKGLLTSIKAKQKLYKSNFFSKDPEKVQKYKQYSNLMINNKLYTRPNDVAEQFNHHFINVGPNLASMIDSTDDDSDPLKYISNSPTDIFFLTN